MEAQQQQQQTQQQQQQQRQQQQLADVKSVAVWTKPWHLAKAPPLRGSPTWSRTVTAALMMALATPRAAPTSSTRWTCWRVSH